MIKKIILLLVSLIYLSGYVRGQNSQIGLPPIQNYSKQDYQAETQNWSVQQDNRGIMYFGNNQGLLEFDGNNWKNFRLPNKSIIRSLAIDSSGSIYVGGQDELGYFDASENGNLVFHSLKEFIPASSQNFEDVWKIFVTPKGVFWGTNKTVFLQKDKKLEVYSTKNRFDNFFFCKDKFYVSEYQVGIQVWRNDSLILVPNGDFFANLQVSSILKHFDGGLLILTNSSGIYHYKDGEISPWGTDFFNYLVENRIYCGLSLKNGDIAIGTSHNGLIILDKNGNPVRIIDKKRGLLNNSILSMCEDNAGNLWLGLENGVSYIEIQSPFSFIDAREGIQGSAYASISHKESLYMATNQGIFVKKWLNTPEGVFEDQFEEVKNAKSPTWGLANINGTLLAGQHLGAFEIEGKKLNNLFSQTGVWKFMQLKKNPQLAIVGTYEGLLLLEKKENSNNWKFKSRMEGIDLSCRVMEEDIDGNIWISHAYRGVYKVTLNKSGSHISKVDFFNSENGFPTDLGINVVKIQDEILFTTEKGIYYYNADQNRFLPHTDFNALLGAENVVHRLIEDEVGNIWFSVGEEFGRLKIEDKAIGKKVEKVNFNQLHKRLVKGFQHIYAYDHSHILIGIDDGFILYNPHQDRNEITKMPVYIRSVQEIGKFDSTIFAGVFIENGLFTSYQPTTQIPSFQSEMQDLRFSYSAAYFENMKEVRYQYKLEGKDLDWFPWTHKTEKEYTNLVPGDYTFKVKAKNIYGYESKVSTYQFTIRAPWYATNFAQFVFFLIAVSLFLLTLYLNTQRVKKSSDKVIQKQAQTIKKNEVEFKREVEKSEAEIIRLQNEKLESEVNHKNKELASYAMHLVQKSEILQRLRKQLEKLKKDFDNPEQFKIEQLVKMIDEDIRLDKNWEQFEFHFDQVHEQFLAKLRAHYSNLTPKDQRLCAYLRMNLATKEIAPLLGISVRGVEISRYRLRKKLNLEHDENLNEFMMNY